MSPDAGQPNAIAAVSDSRALWFNFRLLYDAAGAAVSDPAGTVSEQARFLPRELQALLVENDLGGHDDVVVVAAHFAYPECLRRSVHVCQAERPSAPAHHMGFYANSAIQTHVPRIRYWEDLVMFTREEAAAPRRGPTPTAWSAR